jgi:hypothetical protein
MGRFIITTDKEKFSQSQCECEFCISTHSMSNDWKSFTSRTAVQRNMKSVTKKIEKKYRNKKK